LVVLGTHRLIKAPSGLDAASIRETLAERFVLQDVADRPAELLAALQGTADGPAFGVWAPALGLCLIARSRDPQGVPAELAEGHSAAWRRLDLAAVHTLA